MCEKTNSCCEFSYFCSILNLIIVIIIGSCYLSYSIQATKHNTYILTHYDKYYNFHMTSFTQENKTCEVCVLSSVRVCYQYDKARCDNFNIVYKNDNNDKNYLFECHVFYNNVRDPESMLRNIINEMQHNYTKSFYVNKGRTECHENLNGLLETVETYESKTTLNVLLIIFSVFFFVSICCAGCIHKNIKIVNKVEV